MSKKQKVLQYRNVKTKDLGIVIFVIILLYIVACLIISSKNESIVGYQVKYGALSENRQFCGIALRDENVVNSNYSGYVNYFVSEGDRAAYNNMVFGIDETGKFSSFYGKSPVEDNSLSHSELKSVKQDILLFSKNFDKTYFPSTKAFEEKIGNNITLIENRRIQDDLESINQSSDKINVCRATNAGITLLYLDGFENKKAADLTETDFDKDLYSRSNFVNDDFVEEGSFAYKYVNNENWSICILVPKDEVNKITSYDYIEVKFLKNLTTSYGRVALVKNYDNASLIELSFTNSMVSFCKDRFVDIELMLEEDNGLKVPNTAITEKSFFLIDKNFVTIAGNSTNSSVLRKEYTENGESVKEVPVEIYKEDDDVYYIDSASLNFGDTLISPDKSITTDESEYSFVVSNQGTLTGVYNINKGYADFCRIETLFNNDEYSIVSPSSTYGLRAYDYIALDASIVSNKDFVY